MGLAATVAVLEIRFSHAPEFVTCLILVLAVVVLVIVGLLLFNWRHVDRKSHESTEETIDRLAKEGALSTTNYCAIDAFELVDSDEDDGPHYFIKLANSGTLYINKSSKYFYSDKNETDRDGDDSGRFPCTDFTILRHKLNGQIIKIICADTFLDTETIYTEFMFQLHETNAFPSDGEVIIDRTFEDLKSAAEAAPPWDP